MATYPTHAHTQPASHTRDPLRDLVPTAGYISHRKSSRVA